MGKLIVYLLGLWLSATWVLAFAVMLAGHSIYEPNKPIAIAELSIASLVTLFFIVCIARRRQNEMLRV